MRLSVVDASPHADLLAQHALVTSALRARGDELRRDLLTWLAAAGIKVHSVTVRVKDRDSVARKLARPDRSYTALWDVTDLLGLRIVTYFEDAVDQVGAVLERHLPIDLSRSIDKRKKKDDDGFGYRSLHYVCAIAADDDELRDGPRLGAALPPHARCEIQVSTVLEHAWAEIEHDLGYKAPSAVPDEFRRRLSRVAGLLELADQEFVAIRRGLDDYARALPRLIEAAGEDVPLDRLSLVPLLACREVRELDRAIARGLERELGDQSFFPDYLLKMLAVSGVATVADARAGVQRHADAILAMVGPYFQFAWSAWRLAPDRDLPCGYTLFFLAHVQVLTTPALDLDKVDRLARLYRELDYPDDARAAQRVASMLVDAFRASPALASPALRTVR